MLQTLLFFHILAAIGLFCGVTLEFAALLRARRAQTTGELRAALLNAPVIGPIMGVSAVLLIAMGIAMVSAGGFGWTAGWINAVFAATVVLATVGPLVTGRKTDALHAAAAKAGDGPITSQIDAMRCDRVLAYTSYLGLFELVAALFVMVTKPDALGAAGIIAAAAVAAGVPAALAGRASSGQAAAESS